MNSTAEMFLKYDYAETKDLLKTFLTLISATLVLSLAFSEKIVRFPDASHLARGLMLGAWTLMVGSLVAAGAALALIAAAAGKILYGGVPFLDWEFQTFALASWGCSMGAGMAYVGGLLLLTVSATVGVLTKA